jgi:hypothetical protein
MVYTGGNSVWGEPTAGLGSWTEPRCPVASISGHNVIMAEPCWTNSTARAMLPNGKRTANLVGPASVGKQPTTIENAYERRVCKVSAAPGWTAHLYRHGS